MLDPCTECGMAKISWSVHHPLPFCYAIALSIKSLALVREINWNISAAS
jgi:hypothetical protein